MNKKTLFLPLLVLTVSLLQAQRNPDTFTVMFYNVENLFDTVNHPDFDDDEFTPASAKAWNIEKYEKKLTDIARVILSLPGRELPGIIGFSEVENEQVLNDLINTRGLRKAGYEAVLTEGADPRGIDCGLIYRRDLFRYKSHELIPVEDMADPDYIHRGILHVRGEGPDGKPLHIFVNHWKSRWGGVRETEPKRIYAAIALRRTLDMILSRESDPRYIIMGDFNDDPTNRSLTEVLHAGNKRKNQFINDSYNLFYDLHNMDDEGTLNYQGTWQMYDQIIVSYTLIDQDRGLSTTFTGGRILKEEWMLYHDERRDLKVPNRTYGGDEYFGGISDHLPVYVTFTY
jgi:predicted extracellular nuclease